MKIYLHNYLIITCLCISLSAFGQRQTSLDKALRYLENHQQSYGIESRDIQDMLVSDRYRDEHNGVEHIYFQQSYKGIPIYNAITSIHISEQGEIIESPGRFITEVSKKVNSTKARLTALDALKSSLVHYNIENALLPKELSRSSDNKTLFEKTNFTYSDIPVKLCYVLSNDQKLHLAWDLNLELVGRDDYWSVRVDANNGAILHEQNLTVKCSFDKPSEKDCLPAHSQTFHPVKESLIQQNCTTNGAAVYNVVPLPIESPIHGTRQLVTNPADPIASKFGWHTTKSDGSAEYTSTRGNNVHAYLDRNGDNTPDLELADGGASLNFNFPFDQTLEPVGYTKAAMTNLFYVCNMMHDITYGFGFNEAAGNFQTNTYGKGGVSDRVNAEAQDGSGVNNANFSTPADGSPGRMQMYQWTASLSEVNVDAPAGIAGNISATRGAFGVAPTTTPITAQVVWSDDGSSEARQGCKDAQKSSKLSGKIVLIDRGTCEFGSKAYYAQKAGAVAVIICGFDEQNVSMAAGADGGKVTIPTYYIRASVCAKLKDAVNAGTCTITIVQPMDSNAGPDSIDGDFDNGIVAHEYGHGISNRLTGGPANAGCLGNIDNMGEGWSDFFALITTAKQGAKGKDIRGIGNYALSSPADGAGIRRRPYTTDLNVNEFTYKDVGTETHDIGEVWAAMLWDLYWAMADKYGYDPSFSNRNAGNNKAIQLVMDGMKLQPCSPGFVDGRNAILQADKLNYNGENQCLIWEVFARRGLGFYANQGNSNLAGDEKEDFTTYPICANTTAITKTASPLVKAGAEINYTLKVSNLRASAISNVVITDHIPVGCTYINGSASLTPSNIDATTLTWNISKMDSVETRTITYKLKTDAGKFSNTLWIDDLESPTTEDNYNAEVNKGNIFWFYNPDIGVNDSHAYQIAADGTASSDAFIENIKEIPLPDQDVAFLFFHKYNTQNNIDGGFLQITDNSKQSYSLIDPKDFAINGYSGVIDYNAIAIPKNKGFTGLVTDFIPTVLDLNKFKGKKINIRFRFGNDDNTIPANGQYAGWTIDNLEVINPVFYNAEVCVTTSLGENNCTTVAGKGTLVDSKKVVGVDQATETKDWSLQPNPAKERFIIQIPDNSAVEQIKILGLNGQLIQQLDINDDAKSVLVRSEGFPKGIIMVQLITKEGVQTKKLMIH